MLNNVTSLFKNNKKLKILTCPTHEGYQSLLAETGHEFYMLSGPNVKTWDFHTRALPKNHYIFSLPYDKINMDIEFDLVLTQNRVAQHGLLQQFAHIFNLPVVQIDHTEPPPGISKYLLGQLQSLRGDINVFITEHNKKSWGGLPEDHVISHGINTDIFKGWTGENHEGISIVNHFASRDVFCGYSIWQKVCSKLPVRLVGENPGMSSSINTPEGLADAISRSRFFLNTSTLSPCPLSLLEAMACGCPVVSTAYQEVPNVIKHEYNGLLSNDPAELALFCTRLLEDHELAAYLGANARKTIMEKYSLEQFVTKWNNIFNKAVNK